ncbi:protein FAR1-RELATED SEQUENCE 7-like [Silene latifolia]|uniref:protein FAR1-RELATED SEQUENCE 7-like n=1 Tax=Silene latifolia TaxID=37657 RepID=UPI003D7704BB
MAVVQPPQSLNNPVIYGAPKICKNRHKKNGVQPDSGRACREVEKRFTPYIGQEFGGVEDAVTFYKIYAIACGFDVRRYTTTKWRGSEIKSKLVVYNREGFAHKTPSKDRDDGLVGEKSLRIFRVTRVGCKARIRLYMKNGLLLIDRFHEGQNHELISLKDREFQKLSRNITDYHKMIIVSNSRLKIGATKTYRICKEQDGQLFVDHFKEMTETRIGFYFDYDLDDDGSLRVDHHKRSVTFCGALIAREDYESFNWDDELETAEFDGIWEQIIEDHGVGVNDWFADTYAIREQWVMAHCRDLRMARL